MDWETLKATCLQCTMCPLCQTRHNVVFGCLLYTTDAADD